MSQVLLNVEDTHYTAKDHSVRLPKIVTFADLQRQNKSKDGRLSFTSGDAINYKNPSKLIGSSAHFLRGGIPRRDFARVLHAFLPTGDSWRFSSSSSGR